MKLLFKAIALALLSFSTVSSSFAAAPSGTCGLLLNRQYWGLETVMTNAATNATHSSLMHMDFDNGLATYNSVRTSAYGDPYAVTQEVELSLYFSSTPHNSIPNTHKVTLYMDQAKTNDVGYLNVMSVNGDSTYLVQLVATKNGNSAVGSGAGVCQRF